MIKWRRLSVAFLFVVLAWLLSWGAAMWLVVDEPLMHADAIVVLSGSSTYLERAQTAAQLFKEGKAPKIILTNDNRQGGWSSAEQRNPFFYERTRADLMRLGVPPSSIEVIMQPVYSTYDEGARLREYGDVQSIAALLVVTSPYHSRRALGTFQRAFRGSRTKIGIAHPPLGIQSPDAKKWWTRPRGWQMVPYEYMKLAYYWVRG